MRTKATKHPCSVSYNDPRGVYGRVPTPAEERLQRIDAAVRRAARDFPVTWGIVQEYMAWFGGDGFPPIANQWLRVHQFVEQVRHEYNQINAERWAGIKAAMSGQSR